MKEYGKILSFLNKFAGSRYTQNIDYDKKEMGQFAVEQAKLLGEIIANKFPNYSFYKCSNWQNSGKIGQYLWVQIKRKDKMNLPYSISITTIRGYNGYKFKVYVELADSEVLNKQNELAVREKFNCAVLRRLGDGEASHIYYEGMMLDPFNRKQYIDLSNQYENIQRCIVNDKFFKVTTNINIDLNENEDSALIESRICEAFDKLIPFYNEIFDDNVNASWIIPCNIEYFDIQQAFDDLDEIDWHYTKHTQNIMIGDCVYMYVSKPIGQVMFECTVAKIKLSEPEIDDSKYVKVSKSKWTDNRGYFRIKLLRKLENFKITLSDINENGFAGKVIGPRKLKEQTVQYLTNIKENTPTIEDKISPTTEESEIINDINERELELSLDLMDDGEASYVYKSAAIKIRKFDPRNILELKKKYKGKCQLCGIEVGKKFGTEVVEAHHIEPFSISQNNKKSNIIILCPSCHSLIHKCKATYCKEDLSYKFPNGEVVKISVPGHLKNNS